MAKKTPPDTIGFIGAEGNPRRGGPAAPSIIPTAASVTSQSEAAQRLPQWVEATELPSDEALSAAWNKVPASVRDAFGYPNKNSA